MLYYIGWFQGLGCLRCYQLRTPMRTVSSAVLLWSSDHHVNFHSLSGGYTWVLTLFVFDESKKCLVSRVLAYHVIYIFDIWWFIFFLGSISVVGDIGPSLSFFPVLRYLLNALCFRLDSRRIFRLHQGWLYLVEVCLDGTCFLRLSRQMVLMSAHRLFIGVFISEQSINLSKETFRLFVMFVRFTFFHR